MADIILKIILSILIVGFALGIGLLLRRLVVRRLKKTVLDDWLIQTIGVLITIPVIILGLVLLSFSITMSVDIITTLWNTLTTGLQQRDIANGIRTILKGSYHRHPHHYPRRRRWAHPDENDRRTTGSRAD